MKKKYSLMSILGVLLISFFFIFVSCTAINEYTNYIVALILMLFGLMYSGFATFSFYNNFPNIYKSVVYVDSAMIGLMMGSVFTIVGYEFNLLQLINISVIFFIATFLIYFLFSIFKNKIYMTIIVPTIVISSIVIYALHIWKHLTMDLNIIFTFFFVVLSVHCIIALMVNLIKDAKIEKTMMYAYFAMTIVSMLVAVIFILLGSSDDTEVSVPTGKNKSKSAKRVKTTLMHKKKSKHTKKSLLYAPPPSTNTPYFKEYLYPFTENDFGKEHLQALLTLEEAYKMGGISKENYEGLLENYKILFTKNSENEE